MAIRYAKRLIQSYDGRRDYANQNPCTMVFELIKELKSLTITE